MKIHANNPVSGVKPASTNSPSTGSADSKKSSGFARLEAYASKIEKRFESALSSKGLSTRQRDALEKERDRFQSLLSRFESAYLDSADPSKKKEAAAGMQKLLANFGKSVTHILKGGETTGAEPAPRTTQPNTALNGARRSGRVDVVG
jgi:hypothetical protein